MQKPDCNDVIDEYHSFLAATVKLLRDVSQLYNSKHIKAPDSLESPFHRFQNSFPYLKSLFKWFYYSQGFNFLIGGRGSDEVEMGYRKHSIQRCGMVTEPLG